MRTLVETVYEARKWLGLAPGTLERDAFHYLEDYLKIVKENTDSKQKLSWADLHKMFGKYIYYKSKEPDAEGWDTGYFVMEELRVSKDGKQYVCGIHNRLDFNKYNFYRANDRV